MARAIRETATEDQRATADAFDRLTADMRRTIADTVHSVAWELLADVLSPADMSDTDAFDRATDAILTDCVARIATAGVPAQLTDGDSPADCRAVTDWVASKLRAGVRFRDMSGSVRGPSGNYLPIRDAGWQSLADLWSVRLSESRLAIAREQRRTRVIELDPMVATTAPVTAGYGVTGKTGTVLTDPETAVTRHAYALPMGDGWGVAPIDPYASVGLRVDALALLTAEDRAILAELLLSRRDVNARRRTSAERETDESASDVIDAYMRACNALDTRERIALAAL